MKLNLLHFSGLRIATCLLLASVQVAAWSNEGRAPGSELVIHGKRADLHLRAPIEARPSVEPLPGEVGANRIHTRHRLIASSSDPRAVIFFNGELIEQDRLHHGQHLPALDKLAERVISRAGFDPANATPIALPKPSAFSGSTLGYRITAQQDNSLFVGQVIYYLTVMKLPDRQFAYAVSVQLTTDEDTLRTDASALDALAKSYFESAVTNTTLLRNPTNQASTAVK